MAPIGNPSPFRFPPRPNTSRPNPAPQFASTPRFILSQDSRPGKGQDDIDADESPYSTPAATAWLGESGAGSGSRRREVIQDSEDELSQEGDQSRDAADSVIDGSPTENAGAIDTEFDLLFGSATRSKRRRISLDIDGDGDPGTDTPLARRDKSQFESEPILSSSPEPSWPQTQDTSPLRPRRKEHNGPPGSINVATTSTTGTPKQPTSASTARTTKPTKETPFRPQPRFKFSATQQPPNTQSQSQSQVNPTPGRDASPTRRKRGFILPRSPSPSETREEDPCIPTPFSPSSHALHRRGRRSRAGNAQGQGYLPGGMADDVRRWVLEMGTKREHHPLQQQQRVVENSPSSGIDAPGYFLVGRARKVSQGVLGSSGPVAFVVVECASDSVTDLAGEGRSRMRHILLFGIPRSKPARTSAGNDIPGLQQGNLVGVHKGLVWEIELDNRQPVANSIGEPHGDQDQEKWLVCMEWDIIQ